MSTCKDLTPDEVNDAFDYYSQLLGPVTSFYKSVHLFIYQVLCTLGVLSNICIVVVLLRPPMRRNPFNVFLVAIAICDMTLMATYYVYKQVESCHPMYFTYAWLVFTLIYALLSVFVHSASLWLTVNMAVLRYLVLKDSSNSGSTKYNSYKSAFMAVLAAIVISLIGAAPNMLRYKIEDRGLQPIPEQCIQADSKYAKYYTEGQKVNSYSIGQPDFWNCAWERFSFWQAGIVLKLIPCILLTVFMTLLVRMLVEARERRSRLCASNASSACGSQTGAGAAATGKNQAERTTAMLTMIVALFLVTELPQGLLVFAIGLKPEMRFAMYHLGDIIDLLSLVNSSVNFILYSTMSNMFRREFLNTFGFCCPQPLRSWHSKRRLRSSGVFNKSKKLESRQNSLTHSTKATEQMQRLIQNGQDP